MRSPVPPLLLALTALTSACNGSRGAEPDLSEAVGWLSQNGEVGPCQGVVVAPGRVLTAAHCVTDVASWQPPAPGGVRFLTADHAFVVLEVILPPERALDPSGAIRDLRQDWAILRIGAEGEPLPAPVVVGGRRAAGIAFAFEEPVVKAGVVRPDDGAEKLERLAGCTIRTLDRSRLLLTYSCDGDTGPGLSGSPLLVGTGDGYELLGVMTAKQRLPSGEEVGIVVVPPAEVVPAAGRDGRP